MPGRGESKTKRHLYADPIVVVIENLRRLIADDFEDDGSGTLPDCDHFMDDAAVPQALSLFQLTIDSDWENSGNSSDQVDSLGEDDIREFDGL